VHYLYGASASSTVFVTVSDQTAPAIGAIGVTRELRGSHAHGMRLFRVDYTATDNCSTVAIQLMVAGRDADDRAQVLDAHHVLLKGGLGRGQDGDDDEDGQRVSLTILATDEAGNQASQNVIIGGRSKDR
jgi:hypothetical protein